jgi:hypothetical protein
MKPPLKAIELATANPVTRSLVSLSHSDSRISETLTTAAAIRGFLNS